MHEFLFSPFPLEEFKQLIKDCIKEELNQTQEANRPPQQDDSGHYLTTEEAAQFLKVSLVSIHNWKKEKGLMFYRVGRSIRFKKSDLIAFTEKQRKRRA